MRMKKAVSAFAALTIAAGAFAGMAVTASAEVSYSQDYENTDVVDWTSEIESRYTASIGSSDSNHYLSIGAVDNGNNGTTVATNENYQGIVEEGNDFTISFDISMNGGNQQANTAFEIKSPNGYILNLDQEQAGQDADYIINGNANQKVHFSKETWYKIQVTRQGNNTFLTVKNQDGEIVSDYDKTIIDTQSENGGISGMSFTTGRYYAALKLDNIVIRDVEDEDVPDVVFYNVTLNSVPYAKAVVNGQEYYTDADGVVSLGSAIDGTSFEYEISKGGYQTVSGTETVNGDSLTINAGMDLADSINLYYEDFDTAPSNVDWFTSNTNMTSAIVDGRMRAVNTNGNLRCGYKTLNVNTDGSYDVNFNMEITRVTNAGSAARINTVSFRDENNKVLFGIAVAETGSASNEYELYAYSGMDSNNDINGSDFSKESAIKLADLESSAVANTNVTANIDTANNKVILTVGDDTCTFDTVGLGNTLASLKFSTQKGATIYMDNIVVSDSDGVSPEPEPTPGIGTAAATAVDDGDYSDESDGSKASLWQATVQGDSNTTYTTIQATVVDKNNQTATGSGEISTNITTGGSVFATIVVEGKSQSEIESVTVTLQ